MSGATIHGASELQRMIHAMRDKFPRALESAQNKMIYDVWKAEKEQMVKDIDRPTPWSTGALRYKKVGTPKGREPSTQDAIVYMDDPFRAGEYTGAREYLGVQIVGGETAGPRRSEKLLQQKGWMPRGTVWVPAVGVPLNQYGNINGGVIGGMLQNLGANREGTKSKGAKYILVGPVGREEGVFRLVGKTWTPFIWFVKRPTYGRPKYKFHERGASEIAAQYPGILAGYLEAAMKESVP